jgi:hypothetical protein
VCEKHRGSQIQQARFAPGLEQPVDVADGWLPRADRDQCAFEVPADREHCGIGRKGNRQAVGGFVDLVAEADFVPAPPQRRHDPGQVCLDPSGMA